MEYPGIPEKTEILPRNTSNWTLHTYVIHPSKDVLAVNTQEAFIPAVYTISIQNIDLVYP